MGRGSTVYVRGGTTAPLLALQTPSHRSAEQRLSWKEHRRINHGQPPPAFSTSLASSSISSYRE